MKRSQILVEVVRAEARGAVIKTYRLDAPASLADVLCRVAADIDFRGVDVLNDPVGIFGSLCARDQPVNDGDRIEFYRPLAADPKLARRARVKESRKRSQ